MVDQRLPFPSLQVKDVVVSIVKMAIACLNVDPQLIKANNACCFSVFIDLNNRASNRFILRNNKKIIRRPSEVIKKCVYEAVTKGVLVKQYNFGVRTFLSNGRFKNADHQAPVNSNYSRLSIATFQNLAPDAIVYPFKINEGEKPRFVPVLVATVNDREKGPQSRSLIMGRTLEANLSLDEINEGIRPGRSASHEIADYDTAQYKEDLKKFIKMALEGNDHNNSSESHQ
ncbi:hypothetical protein LguiA_005333 [Lonicera macranthoides]